MNQIEDRTGKQKLVNWRQLDWFQGELKEITKHQFEKLVQSIIKNGFRDGFKVWDTGDKKWILDGHQRYEALKEVEKRGYKIPDLLSAEFVECENEAEAAELVVLYSTAYAKISEQGLYEFTHKFELDYNDLEIKYDIPEFDFDHYKANYFEDLEIPENVDDIPEVEETDIKEGDLFILGGKHRLLCGDCTVKENIELLMDGQKADITFTSPPYNIGSTPNGDKQKYLNSSDNLQCDDYTAFLGMFLRLTLQHSDFVFTNIQSVAGNKLSIIEHLYEFKDNYCDVIIWDKEVAEPAMQARVLNSMFEYIHVFGHEGKRTIGTKNFRGTISNIFRLNSRQGKEHSDIHKATFPVELPMFVVENFCEESCLDPFLGSGTTLIACEQTDRICCGMEIDPHYCQVIIDRFKNLTGKEVEKVKPKTILKKK